MKNNTVAFLFCLNSTIAYATQPFTVEKPVVCSDVKTIIEFVSGQEYREVPAWVGKDETSKFVMMANEKTKTWTLVQFNDQVACVLGSGTDGQILLQKSSIKRHL